MKITVTTSLTKDKMTTVIDEPTMIHFMDITDITEEDVIFECCNLSIIDDSEENHYDYDISNCFNEEFYIENFEGEYSREDFFEEGDFGDDLFPEEICGEKRKREVD